MLFNIFVNDLDAGVECMIRELDDESKLGGAIDSLMGQEAFHKALDRLVHWSIIKGMKFNKNRHWTLPLALSNTWHKHELGVAGEPL